MKMKFQIFLQILCNYFKTGILNIVIYLFITTLKVSAIVNE